jgi:carbon-monoxide dehydrogenase large subunit
MIGERVARLEDARLLAGHGRFVEDLTLPGMAHAVVVRSPVAHARLGKVDVTEAAASPGVLSVLTASDLAALGVRPMPCTSPVDSHDGAPFQAPERYPLARERVRFVGDPVALVVAETLAVAEDAAERVAVDYEDLPVQIDPRRSEEIAFVWEAGEGAAVAAAFAAAAHTVALESVHGRIVVNPIETRSALGAYDRANGAYLLHTQSQGVHFVREMVARTLGIEPQQVRVVTGDVGGSFGIKITNYPEHTLVLAAAKALGRPVRWVASRSEAFLSDAQGRGQVSRAELALDGHHRILALRVQTRGDLGAYASALAPGVVSKGFAKTLGHVYRIPALHVHVTAVYTHTAPTDAYRGAGKPESVCLVERLVEKAARVVGEDPVAFRRRNLVPAAAMPYSAANGATYDSGDFEAVMDRALAAADRAGFAERRRRAEARGMRRGFGLGLYLHLTGGDPAETSEVMVTREQRVLVKTGVQASGQGHETAFAQLVAGRLAIPIEHVHVIEGDSAQIGRGGGTGGSSSLPIAATTIARATEAMLAAARELAAERLECAAVDLEYGGGGFTVVGTDRRIGLFELAHALPTEQAGACAGTADCEGETQTVPHGAYLAEVEVDPQTGRVRLMRMVCVDDLGVRLNPVIAEGQLHGGLAQGIGQVLLEHTVYDAESGQLLTGSFMDYALPRADDLPGFELHAADRPTKCNALGMKGAGEVATMGAPAAVMNAVCDAIGDFDFDLPATPERVWRALQRS